MPQVGPGVLSSDVALRLATGPGGLQRCSVHLYQSQFLGYHYGYPWVGVKLPEKWGCMGVYTIKKWFEVGNEAKNCWPNH